MTKESNKEGSKFKVADHVRLPKYKRFLQKAMLRIDLKKFLWLKKLKLLCHRYVVSFILTEKKSLERFTKKNCKEQNKKSLKSWKSIKEKRR